MYSMNRTVKLPYVSRYIAGSSLNLKSRKTL